MKSHSPNKTYEQLVLPIFENNLGADFLVKNEVRFYAAYKLNASCLSKHVSIVAISKNSKIEKNTVVKNQTGCLFLIKNKRPLYYSTTQQLTLDFDHVSIHSNDYLGLVIDKHYAALSLFAEKFEDELFHSLHTRQITNTVSV